MSAYIKTLARIAPASQVKAMVYGLVASEEREYFAGKFKEYAERDANMCKVYEQDGKGRNAIVFLHLFKSSADFYITERDITEEQLQAFGAADIGYGPELGYINIQE